MDQNIDNEVSTSASPDNPLTPPTALPEAIAPKSKVNKIVAGFLIGLILIAAGAVLWIYFGKDQNETKSIVESKQVSSEVKDTQTFKNDRFYFTFQYPKDWVAVAKDDGFPMVTVMPEECVKEYCEEEPRSMFSYLRIYQTEGEYSQKSIAELKKNHERISKDPLYSEQINYENSKLGGKEALIMTTPDFPGYKKITVFVNGIQFDFEVGTKSKAETDAILKSVKFEDPIKPYVSTRQVVDDDDKVLASAKESLKYVDNFQKEKGYFPCESEFYENFWNKKYIRSIDFDKPSYNDPIVDYRPDCQRDTNKAQKFISLCYTLHKPNPIAFGSSYPASYGMVYCVTSSQEKTGSVYDTMYYKDALAGF